MKIYFCKVSELLAEISEQQIYKQIPDWRKKSADACKNTADRQRSLAVSYLLCECMKEHGVLLQKAPDYTKSGKMYFPDAQDFYVNLSHADDYAVCAYNRHEIGVDVEGIRQYRDSVMMKVCSQKEMESLNAKTDLQEKNRLFSEMWTKKESRVKLTGEGIAGLLPGMQPQKKIYTRVYYPCHNCFLAVSSFTDNFCEKVDIFSGKAFLDDEKK